MTLSRICCMALAACAPLFSLAEEQAAETPAIPPQEIQEAALYGKIDVIEKALAQGYKTDTRDAEQRTALMYAAFNGQKAIAERLIEAGADVNLQDGMGSTALMFAASGPSTETVQLLLDHGAKINMVDSNEHFSALMWAAAEGQAENVKLLLKHGADLSLKDVDGDTAASFAAQRGHTAIVTLLQETASKNLETEKTE